MRRIESAWTVSLLLAALVVGSPPVARAETEPNDTCPTAESLGEVTLPFLQEGSLDSTPESPDIDFFLVSVPPGQLVRVDLAGAVESPEPLSDPLLGVFDSGCQLLAVDDDSGGGLDSRLAVRVPADGQLVVAATAYPDFEFVGGGQGAYRLTLGVFRAAGSIGGRLVDAETGQPLRGDVAPYGFVDLYRCGEAGCAEFAGAQSTDSEGRFSFETDFAGNPLEAGSYQIEAFAFLYESARFAPFTVGEGESLDLGDLPLMPFEFIGTVSGRVLDALDGSPLRGGGPPFAFVLVERCEDFGCFGVAFAVPDEMGRFQIDGISNFLTVGTYRLAGFADQYLRGESELFTLGEGEDLDAGDLLLPPLRIQFGEIEPCTIPAEGGTCLYRAEIRHRGGERFDGETWSRVHAWGTGSNLGYTEFQTGRLGTVNPMPQKLNLKTGERSVLEFQFDVPATVGDGAFFCAETFVGEEPSPLFDTLTGRFLFCVSKGPGGFVTVPEKEARRKLRELERKAHP